MVVNHKPNLKGIIEAKIKHFKIIFFMAIQRDSGDMT